MHTSYTKHNVPDIFNLCKNHTTFTVDNRLKKQFAFYDFDTPVTLKQGQCQQTWYELVNPKQCYNSTKFEKPCLNSVHEKTNDKDVKSGYMSMTSLEYVHSEK